ncbi:MAG: hypothetical protein SVY53_04970 [Chloroflexota bacterium]|nr:hypothetical protein [Chloroflexota bacterium]
MFEKSQEDIVLKVPILNNNGETLKYRLMTEEGKEPIAHQTHSINRKQEGDTEFYEISCLTEYVGGGSLEETGIYKVNDVLTPFSYLKTVRGRSGSIVANERTEYDGQFEFPLNTSMPSSAGMIIFRGGPFITKGKFAFHFLMPPAGRPVKMWAEALNETITVPAGTFECHKYKVMPDAKSMMEQMMPPGVAVPPGFETFMGSLFPPTHRWISQIPPHYIVKAEGTIVSPVPFITPNPTIVELVDID